MNIHKIDKITLKYGKFKLSKLLNNQPYSILLIDTNNKDFIHTDGIDDAELLRYCKSNFPFEFMDISALYGKPITDNNLANIHVFAFNKEITDESYNLELYELLVFHETLHFLEKTGKYKELKIKLENQDLLIGKELNSIAQKLASMFGSSDLDHNETFGALFNYFLRKFDKSRKHQLLNKAMSKNFLDDYSENFL